MFGAECMNGAVVSREKVAGPGAERRREKRYEVELNGLIQADGLDVPARLSDMSASGALAVVAADAPVLKAGAAIQLVVEEFDTIRSRIAHVGKGFYGISFENAHLHRQRLKTWLLAYVGEG